MAVNANPELQPSRNDSQTELLYKLNRIFGAVDWETITDRLIKIDANTDEIEPKVDNLIVEAVAINMNTDELEERIGVLAGPKVTNPDAASASLNSLLRGILEAINSVASALTPTTPAVGTWASSADNTPFVVFPSNACKSFRFKNRTGKSLIIQKVGGSNPEVLDTNDSATYPCVANMDEWEWANADDAVLVSLRGIFDNT